MISDTNLTERYQLENDKCPHCGWTPAEQDKLSNDRHDLLAALRGLLAAFAGCIGPAAFREFEDGNAQIIAARAAIDNATKE